MAEESRTEADNRPKNFQQWIEYVDYDWRRDTAGELRNALLVVAVLFITVAFQAGINLPAHIFPQDNKSTGTTNQAVFLASNTILLSTSMHIIIFMTGSLPFRKEIMAAAWLLMSAYCCSLSATDLPASLKFPILSIPGIVWVLRWVPYFRALKRRIYTSTQPDQQ